MPKISGTTKWYFFLLLSGFLQFGCEPDRPENDTKFPAVRVNSLYIDGSGVVWAGSDVGIISFREEKWTTYKNIEQLPSGEVKDIAYQHTQFGDEIWLATPNGAGVVNYDVDAVSSATSYTVDASEILDNSVQAVVVDAQEARWFSTPRGLSIFKGSNWYAETDWDELLLHPVISLGTGNDGWVFAGTSGLGVGRFRYDEGIDGITGASYYNSEWSGLSSDTVLCIYVDKNNHQWFGTHHGAAYHAAWETKLSWQVYTVTDGLIDNHVQAISEDDQGIIWFGTAHGISSFDGASWNNYNTDSGLVHASVNDIAVDAAGTLWFATDGGISTFDGTTWKNYSR